MPPRQVVVGSPPTMNRQQPLLPPRRRRSSRLGEKAGETAAVCCCCPCMILNLFILGVYKVPARLCRMVWKKTRRPKKRKTLLKKKNNASAPQQIPGAKVSAGVYDDADDYSGGDDTELGSGEPSSVADDLEKKMWAQFNGAGFWRSPSQTEGELKDSE